MNAQDVLHAWRDFECSFFAGALLCPKLPFRRFLNARSYRVERRRKLGLTPAVVMRRMTEGVAVSATGISSTPIRPGTCARSIAATASRCRGATWRRRHDPVSALGGVSHARRASRRRNRRSQISVMQDGDRSLLYVCHSRRTNDMAGNPHVLSVGIDLVPALESQGIDAAGTVSAITLACRRKGGQATIPPAAAKAIGAVGGVLNIAWIADALEAPASMICPRSNQRSTPGNTRPGISRIARSGINGDRQNVSRSGPCGPDRVTPTSCEKPEAGSQAGRRQLSVRRRVLSPLAFCSIGKRLSSPKWVNLMGECVENYIPTLSGVCSPTRGPTPA